MASCQCEGIRLLFNRKVAARELRRYRKRGPINTTRLLIDALKAEGVQGLTLLDIGGGVGAIQHELLEAGVSNAVSVDASPAYLETAQSEAQRQGHTGRVTYHLGDFVEMAKDTLPADIVTLDRVVCCYHDMSALVGLSAARARKLYGLVYPRGTWWVKAGFGVLNLFCRLQRNPFRGFVHPSGAVDAMVRGSGLTQRFYQRTLIWQVAVYSR